MSGHSGAGMHQGIGVFGGTFDPVHIGHLRLALELKAFLQVAEMRLLPNANPYHRHGGASTAEQRLAMLSLAADDEPQLVIDTRELQRSGPTYSVDTLQEMRAESGCDVPLYFCIGMDSLINLTGWSRWRQLLDYAHVVVACRPGFTLPTEGELAKWLSENQVDSLQQLKSHSCGSVLVREMSLLPVSGTGIREKVVAGESLRYLVPDSVIGYIEQNGLYLEKPC